MPDDSAASERYRPLHDWLISCPLEDVQISLPEIEEILGFRLPKRAWEKEIWWYSTSHNTWARSWLLADRAAVLDVARSRVTFTVKRFSSHFDVEGAAIEHANASSWARRQLGLYPGWNESHIPLGWWERHTVYVIHKDQESLYKVGVTNARTDRRIREQTSKGRGTLVASIEVPNKWDAVLVEGRVLELTKQVRKFADPFTSLHGQTEHWDDSVAPPDLTKIVAELASDDSLTHWGTSVDRDGAQAAAAESESHE